MTTEKIKEVYTPHDSEKLYSVFVNMTNRKKYKQFDNFNTPEQVDKSIQVLIDIFKERGIVFKKMEMGKKWVEAEFNPTKTYIKLYSNQANESGEMTFEAIGQY